MSQIPGWPHRDRRAPPWRWVAVVVAAVAVMAGCGNDDGGTAAPTTAAPTTAAGATTSVPGGGAVIEIRDFSFGEPLTVPVGTTVTVVNRDGVTHTWTNPDGLWDSGNLTQGAEFAFTFEEPGTYRFVCTIHPTMEGEITVTG